MVISKGPQRVLLAPTGFPTVLCSAAFVAPRVLKCQLPSLLFLLCLPHLSVGRQGPYCFVVSAPTCGRNYVWHIDA